MACLTVPLRIPARAERISDPVPQGHSSRALFRAGVVRLRTGRESVPRRRAMGCALPAAGARDPAVPDRAIGGRGPSSQVHVDLDHPRIAKRWRGRALVRRTGRPSPYLEQAASRLGDLDEAYRASGAFYAALERYELLEPFSLDVELEDGSKHRLVGYHLIDEQRLMSRSTRRDRRASSGRPSDADVHGDGVAVQHRRIGRAQEPDAGLMAEMRNRLQRVRRTGRPKRPSTICCARESRALRRPRARVRLAAGSRRPAIVHDGARLSPRPRPRPAVHRQYRRARQPATGCSTTRTWG